MLKTYQENNLHKQKTDDSLEIDCLITHHSFSLNNDAHHQTFQIYICYSKVDIHAQAVLTVYKTLETINISVSDGHVHNQQSIYQLVFEKTNQYQEFKSSASEESVQVRCPNRETRTDVKAACLHSIIELGGGPMHVVD